MLSANSAGLGGDDNWRSPDGTYTVVSATGTTFKVTGTTYGDSVNGDGTSGTATYYINGATGTGTYPYTNANGATGTGSYTYTGTITTHPVEQFRRGENVAHGAIDSAGDLWITTEADPSGGTANTAVRLQDSTGVRNFPSIVTDEQPEFPAIDAANNAWIAIQETPAQIDVVSSSGAHHPDRAAGLPHRRHCGLPRPQGS